MAKKAEKTKTTKPRKRKKAWKFTQAAGLNEAGIDIEIDDAERERHGFHDYPWSAAKRAAIKKTVEGLQTVQEVRAAIRSH